VSHPGGGARRQRRSWFRRMLDLLLPAAEPRRRSA
jgi:hypothetical protein